MNSAQQYLPPVIRQKLVEVRRELRKYIIAYALLAIGCWLLLLFWLGGLIDFLPVTFGVQESPRWVRFGWLLMMALGSGWILLFWAAPRLWAKIHDRSLALLIERHYPQLNYQLVTAVESHESEGSVANETGEAASIELDVSNPQARREMLQRVERILDQSMDEVRPAELFDWRPIRAGVAALVLSALVTLLSVWLMPGWMQRWSQRLFALSDEPWPRRAALRPDGIQIQLPAFTGQLAADRKLLPFADGVVRVTRGSSAVLQVSANADRKQVPEVCTLFYETQSGTRGRANLRRMGAVDEGWQQFVLDGPPLDGISEDLSLDVVGLDARLSDLQIRTIEPAVIKDMRLELSYPDYLMSSLTRESTETLEYRTGMRIPQGTHLRLLGSSSADLEQVQYVRRSLEANEDGASRFSVESVACDGAEFAIDLGLVNASEVIEIRLLDRYGLTSDQIPRYLLNVQQDTVPEVLARLVGIGNAVTEEAMIPIQGTVEDDHGVASLAAELSIEGEQPVRLPLQLPQTEVFTSTIDLKKLKEDEIFSVSAGESLGLVVTAADYFDLNGESHLGMGQPKQLQIVKPDELLVLLDREELELRQRLEIIISELQQMRSSLDSMMMDLSQTQGAQSSVFTFVTQQETNEDAARIKRMLILRAQQAVLQGDKSEQEILGVAVNVDGIRLQLVNNRIDSYDRQQRLSEKVYQPLMTMLETEYPILSSNLAELQSASMSGECAEQIRGSLRAVDAVLLRLAEIKESMKYLESFNEIIDLVRSLLEDQERVLSETEKAQKERILQLLK
ncbi:MAG: hypothetical protein NXI32_03440 [bacterium]|nr:hypothetical protein [bacterium]